jgi:mannose-6-phosphate isomerase-like protein (cupin superfamily)
LEEIKVVPKVWGEEQWIVNRDYCGKILVLKKGYRCSIHCHKKKDETFYLLEGKVLMELGDKKFVMKPGEAVHVPVGSYHRFSGIEDSRIIEFSTKHSDSDSYRKAKSGQFDLKEAEGFL